MFEQYKYGTEEDDENVNEFFYREWVYLRRNDTFNLDLGLIIKWIGGKSEWAIFLLIYCHVYDSNDTKPMESPKRTGHVGFSKHSDYSSSENENKCDPEVASLKPHGLFLKFCLIIITIILLYIDIRWIVFKSSLF